MSKTLDRKKKREAELKEKQKFWDRFEETEIGDDEVIDVPTADDEPVRVNTVGPRTGRNEDKPQIKINSVGPKTTDVADEQPKIKIRTAAPVSEVSGKLSPTPEEDDDDNLLAALLNAIEDDEKEARDAATEAAEKAAAKYYTVKSGDTLSAIAKRHGKSLSAIQKLNPGLDPNKLRIGQKIRVN